jgi:hypothetical protein
MMRVPRTVKEDFIMTATERVVRLSNARRIRENEYRARCPVHQGKSDTSLSIKNAGDRVLVHCHNQCDLTNILAALGMRSAAELFDIVRAKPDPEAERQARIRRGLEIWVEKRLVATCVILRQVDYCINESGETLQRYENGELPRNAESEAEWWDILGRAIRVRSLWERQFEILNGKDLDAKYELFRSLK